jgi:hypothetical protein
VCVCEGHEVGGGLVGGRNSRIETVHSLLPMFDLQCLSLDAVQQDLVPSHRGNNNHGPLHQR